MAMDKLSPPVGISPEDWAATPASVRMVVLALWERVEWLEERLHQTSRNSSRPPSADPPSVVRPKREPSGRKAGGQPGHVGSGRELKCVNKVDHLIEVKPTACARCGSLLLGEDPHPLR